MKLLDAINLVLELAQGNVLAVSEVNDEPALVEEASRQQEAVDIVSDYVANYLGDKIAEEESDSCPQCGADWTDETGQYSIGCDTCYNHEHED